MKPQTGYSLQRTVTYIILLSALITFCTIAIMVWNGHNFWIDSKAFMFARSLQNETTNRFFLAVTFLGSSSFLLPANIILIILAIWSLRNKHLAMKLSIISISSLLFMYIFKFIFKRSRPEDFLLEQASGFSFPSGHTLNSTVFFGLLIYFLHHANLPKAYRPVVYLFFGLIVFLIGFSRIYLHVHYASDVLAGFMLGLGWLIVSLKILKSRG